MFKRVLIYLIIMTFCFSQISIAERKNLNTIIGKWKVTEVKFPSRYFDVQSCTNIAFFGSEVWSEAVGKVFDFITDSTLCTNVIVSDNKPIYLFYNVRRSLCKISYKKEDKVLSFFLKVEIIDNKMVWIIDDRLIIMLERDNH